MHLVIFDTFVESVIKSKVFSLCKIGQNLPLFIYILLLKNVLHIVSEIIKNRNCLVKTRQVATRPTESKANYS